MERPIPSIKPITAIIIFGALTVYFYLLLRFFYPFLVNNLDVHRALYWFITGYAFFIPLFVTAVLAVRREGARSLNEMAQALCLRRMTGRDWVYSIVSLVAVFALTGVIMYASKLLHDLVGIRELAVAPPELTFEPFKGSEKLLLLVWFPMWLFNIFGEELLWRGYIQMRLGFRFSWLLTAVLWAIVHIPFGPDMVILLIPILIILPYAVQRTGNTWVGIIIHGLYNGPIFVLISLGVLG